MREGKRYDRILYVDAPHAERELVRQALQTDAGLALTETTSRREFESALAAQPFDLVLSDFNIHGYDGSQVVSVVQKSQPNVPLVIVTDAGSQKTAVDALKLGAADYVIKSPDHIVRLPLTIRTVLEKSRLRAEYERLRVELDLLFTVSHEMLIVIDGEGRLQRTNPTFREMFGLSSEPPRETTIYELIVDTDRSEGEAGIQHAGQTGQSSCLTVRCRRVDDTICWIEWNVFRSNDSDRLFAIGRDVSKRRAAEDEERERVAVREKLSTLSRREREVLKLVVEGKPNKQIAFELGLARKTIERYRSTGMRKLKAASIPDLVRMSILADL